MTFAVAHLHKLYGGGLTIWDNWENHQQNHTKEGKTKSSSQRQNLVETKKVDGPFDLVAWRSSN